jgi:hypothetical protein
MVPRITPCACEDLVFLIEEKLAGRFPSYPILGLDASAQSKISPLVRSTSEALGVGQSPSEKKIQPHDPSHRINLCTPAFQEAMILETRAKRRPAKKWSAPRHSTAPQRRETHDRNPTTYRQVRCTAAESVGGVDRRRLAVQFFAQRLI